MNGDNDSNKSLKKLKLHRRTLPKQCVIFASQLYGIKDFKNRQRLYSKIIRMLCDHFKLPRCRCRIYCKRRPKLRGSGKYLLGYYTDEYGTQPLIELWNFTIKGRLVSNRSLFSTFLHEFVHHYDNRRLRLDLDHDEGFWARVKHIETIFKTEISKLENKNANK
jgi:hypothetical protein